MAKKSVPLLVLLLFLMISCKQRQETVEGYRPPEFKGIAFVTARDANHVGVLNLADASIGRIVLDRRPSAISLASNRLYIFSRDGMYKSIDLSTSKSSNWKRIAPSICDAETTEGKTIYLTTRREPALIAYSIEKGQTMNSLKLSPGDCNISVSDPAGLIIITNNRNPAITIIDKKTWTIKERIPNAGNSIHHARLLAARNEIWVAEGNEFKDGKPYGVGFAKAEAVPGGLNLIDLKTGQLKDFIMVGGNVEDLGFSSDGRYIYTISSQMPEYDDAALNAVDFQKTRSVKQYSLCKVCHYRNGIQIKKIFVTSLVVDEKATAASVKGLLESGFQSTEPGGESVIIKQIYEKAE